MSLWPHTSGFFTSLLKSAPYDAMLSATNVPQGRFPSINKEGCTMQVRHIGGRKLLAAITLASGSLAIAQDTPNAPASNSAGMDPNSVASAASAPGTIRAKEGEFPVLSYLELMKMTWSARSELLDRYPSAERGVFLDSLSGPRRAVVMTDPNDCGSVSRLKRTTFANNKQDPGFAANAAQDVAQSAVLGLLGSLGSVLSAAAKVNEGQKLLAYKDVCDLSAEEKEALLSPKSGTDDVAADSKKSEESALDKASKFFSR